MKKFTVPTSLDNQKPNTISFNLKLSCINISSRTIVDITK